eukprot:m.285242 g.285242  ORF g.285242 m.285242 type:complete len:104 (+) comp11332_c0_seq1:1374-1685(+)
MAAPAHARATICIEDSIAQTISFGLEPEDLQDLGRLASKVTSLQNAVNAHLSSALMARGETPEEVVVDDEEDSEDEENPASAAAAAAAPADEEEKRAPKKPRL